MKRMFIGIIFGLMFLPLKVFGITSGDYTYELDSNGNAVISSYVGNSTTIVIPSTIDGKNVKSIKAHAFDNAKGKTLKKVTISEGITSVGDFAFINNPNLESVHLPNSLTSLGDQTFIGCTKLKTINIPNNLKSFRTYVFQETGFTEFTIHENFESIGTSVFRICPNLKTVKIYSRNVVFADNVFEYHSSDLVIYGYAGSTTETYARNNGITFKKLETPSEPTVVPVKSIKLNKTSLNLKEGETYTLTSTISPTNATNKKVTWESSNKNVATVSSNGKVTAKSSGTTVITIYNSDRSVSAKCTVTVTKDSSNGNNGNGNSTIPVTDIKLDKDKVTLKIKETTSLSVNITPDNATNKDLKWESSDTNVVKVIDGNLTAVGKGEAIITVTSNNGKQATCKVVVTQDEEIPNNKVDIYSIVLSNSNIELNIGDNYALNVSIYPENATDKTLLWYSYNEKVVTVKDGELKAVGVGETKITVTSADGKIQTTCNVIVRDSKEENTSKEKNFFNKFYIIGLPSILIVIILITFIIKKNKLKNSI